MNLVKYLSVIVSIKKLFEGNFSLKPGMGNGTIVEAEDGTKIPLIDVVKDKELVSGINRGNYASTVSSILGNILSINPDTIEFVDISDDLLTLSVYTLLSEENISLAKLYNSKMESRVLFYDDSSYLRKLSSLGFNIIIDRFFGLDEKNIGCYQLWLHSSKGIVLILNNSFISGKITGHILASRKGTSLVRSLMKRGINWSGGGTLAYANYSESDLNKILEFYNENRNSWGFPEDELAVKDALSTFCIISTIGCLDYLGGRVRKHHGSSMSEVILSNDPYSSAELSLYLGSVLNQDLLQGIASNEVMKIVQNNQQEYQKGFLEETYEGWEKRMQLDLLIECTGILKSTIKKE